MTIVEIIRAIFGGLFLLFVPGFAWSYVFFARKNINGIERVALSFGLSVALVPLTVFWLNFMFQVKVTLVNTCLVVCGLTVIPAVYFLIKRSSWGENAASRLKSAFRPHKGKKSQ